MARKSRKQNKSAAIRAETAASQKGHAGLYTRLSVEDNGYGTKDSIQNQIAFLKDYIGRHEDELELTEVYVDNGTTGTNFEREEWNRLIADIKDGKIDCVVIKDFSRMGRNYIEVGNYLEKIFPFLGVRVIAVNENYDSQKQTFQNSMLMNSLTNIVNEYYARDISKKITQTKRTMQKKGIYASGVLPYGYQKTEDKQFIVDPECGNIVRKIFEWRAQGKGCLVIANYLNELAVPSPGMYRYMNGNTAFKRCSNTKWKSKHIAGILTNPVYLGHMVQGKTRCSYFEQEGKLHSLPREDWIIVENTHEPLATQEQFDIAAAMAEKSRQKHIADMTAHADVPHVENPLRKKVFCGQCGRHMTRRSRVQGQVRDYCYYCEASHMRIGTHCTNTHIHEVPLMEALQKIADQQLRMTGAWENQWLAWKHSEEGTRDAVNICMREKQLNDAIAVLKRQKQECYADLKGGLLSLGDYEYEKKHLLEKQERYERELDELQQKKEQEQELQEKLQEYRSDVLSMESEEIPLEMLNLLISRITVFSPERVEVAFSFADEWKKWKKEL